MPSMGVLGAIKGGADALGGVIKGDIEEARKVRLENLRTQNNQATNTLNNTERHQFKTTEQTQQHDLSMSQKAKEHDYSLTELSQKGDQAAELATHQSTLRSGEPTTTMKDAEYWRTEGGVEPSQQYADDQKVSTRSYGGSGLPADAKMMNYLMDTMSMSQEDAQRFVREKSETSPAEFRRNMLEKLVEAGYTTDEALTEVDTMMTVAYPPRQQGAPAPQQAPAPGGNDADWPAPRQAPDGNMYIKKGGKLYRVGN